MLHLRKRLFTLALAVLGATSFGLIADTSAVSAAGICTIYADNPHKSTHVQTNINAVGRVDCSYAPLSGLLLDVRLQKRSSSGSWSTQATTTRILDDTPTFARTSEAMPCVNGTFRTQARVLAAGPRGQAAVWSLWATGYNVTITCGVGGGSGSW